jgi:hypothetical protein
MLGKDLARLNGLLIYRVRVLRFVKRRGTSGSSTKIYLVTDRKSKETCYRAFVGYVPSKLTYQILGLL